MLDDARVIGWFLEAGGQGPGEECLQFLSRFQGDAANADRCQRLIKTHEQREVVAAASTSMKEIVERNCPHGMSEQRWLDLCDWILAYLLESPEVASDFVQSELARAWAVIQLHFLGDGPFFAEFESISRFFEEPPRRWLAALRLYIELVSAMTHNTSRKPSDHPIAVRSRNFGDDPLLLLTIFERARSILF
jgi:hypothetical protein